MLIRSQPVRIESQLAPEVVRQRLSARGGDWRESTVSPSARAAGILGWRVWEKNSQLFIRPRIAGGNTWLPTFVGRVETSSVGAMIVGQLRLTAFARVFSLFWLAAIASAPVLTLIEPIPESTWIGRLLFAVIIMLPAAAGLIALGLWMIRRASRAPSAAIREILADVAAVGP